MIKKTRTKKNTKATAQPNIGIEISEQAAQTLFYNHVRANQYVEDFMFGIMFLTRNFRSFTYTQLVAATRHLDIPPLKVGELLVKWADVMVRLGRVEILDGCDETIYLMV